MGPAGAGREAESYAEGEPVVSAARVQWCAAGRAGRARLLHTEMTGIDAARVVGKCVWGLFGIYGEGGWGCLGPYGDLWCVRVGMYG